MPGVSGMGVNYYDSEEAAMYEVAWHKVQGRTNAKVILLSYLHTVALAKERWEK